MSIDKCIYTTAEVSKILGITPATLSKYLKKAGQIDGVFKEGRNIKINSKAIDSIKIYIDYNNDYVEGQFLKTNELAKTLNNMGLDCNRININNWIRDGIIQSIRHIGYHLINKDHIETIYSTLTTLRVIPEGYCSVEEAARKINIHPGTIGKWAKNKDIESKIVIVNKYQRLYVNPETLEEVNYDKKIKMISGLKKVKIENFINKKNTIRKKRIINNTKIENLKYITVKEASLLLGISVDGVRSAIKKGRFNNVYTKKNSYYISKIEVENYDNSRRKIINLKTQNEIKKLNETGYFLISEVAKSLVITVYKIKVLITNKQIIPITINGRSYVNEILVKELVSKNIKKNPKKDTSPTTKQKLIKDISVLVHSDNSNTLIISTNKYYIEFCTIKLQATLGRETNWRRIYGCLKNIYKKIIINLTDEIYLIPITEIEGILLDTNFSTPVKEIFLQFIKNTYSLIGLELPNEYVVSRSNKATKKNIKEELYSPEVYYEIIEYVKNSDFHLSNALLKREYANMWVHVIMLTSNVWRPSDIIHEMPRLDLAELKINNLEWFQNHTFTNQHAMFIISQLQLKLKNSMVSKTNVLLHFLVPPDMAYFLALACVISELHCRQFNNQENLNTKLLLGSFVTINRNGDFNTHTSGKDIHLHFFKKKKHLIPLFGAKKLNCSTETYLFLDISENIIDSPELALEFPQYARSHKNIETTVAYIKLTNRDGSQNRVSLNLFKRGHFGWVYNLLIKMAYNKFEIKQSLEQRTNSIISMKQNFTPIQLENWANHVIVSQNSLIKKLYKMDSDYLKVLLLNIFKGKMPSRDKSGQCIIHPECEYPKRKTCLGCINFIPQLQLIMHEAIDEFKRLINSLNKTENNRLIERDSIFLLNILLLFNEIATEYGTDSLDGIFNKKERDTLIHSISHKIFLER